MSHVTEYDAWLESVRKQQDKLPPGAIAAADQTVAIYKDELSRSLGRAVTADDVPLLWAGMVLFIACLFHTAHIRNGLSLDLATLRMNQVLYTIATNAPSHV
jgi:hypothetical protein